MLVKPFNIKFFQMTKPRRALSPRELVNKKFELLAFEGRWQRFIGTPGKQGVWLVWGHSGNGKTSLMMQLARYLSRFARVAYNSIEEGVSRSLQLAVIRNDMQSVKNFVLLSEDIATLRLRLEKRRSPDIVIVDSFQFANLNKLSYKALKDAFPCKLFIFVSHAEGKNPLGRPAGFVRYDADVKIRVEGYRAFAQSRYGGDGKPLTIWEEGAADYWG